MVRTTLVSTLIVTLLILMLQLQPAVAGTTSDDVASKAEDWIHTFKGYLLAKKKEAVKYGKVLLDKADQAIDGLSQKATDASGEAKSAYLKEIDELKQKRAAAAKKLDEMGNATEDSWDDAKKGFSDAYEALYDATVAAINNFK